MQNSIVLGRRRRTLHVVALGCPKNRVDSERMAGLAPRHGLELVADPAAADIIVVNTCAFVAEAVEESIDAVLDLGRLKAGRCSTLIVAGCLAQRHPEDLAVELPEVDHFIGTSDFERLDAILAGDGGPRVAVGQPGGVADERFERAGSGHSAYLKIAEGCDRPCAFCIIPSLRGPQRSRSVPSLVAEAGRLVEKGAEELVLVAQDTTAYGSDLCPPVHLADLLQALASVRGRAWIRVLYAYPSAVDHRLIGALAEVPGVVPYLDVPVQHIDDEVLRRMRRGYTGDRVRRCIDELRSGVEGIALRTTLLCGHPGETEAAHRALVAFVAEAELDHLGAFAFSAEQGAPSAGQPDQVPPDLARERVEEVMACQREVSRRKGRAFLGREIEVLVDGPSPESEYLTQGRHAGQAPEVDGVVILTDAGCSAGQRVTARVIEAGDYDLVANVVARPERPSPPP